jgi:hypothetical protein
VRGKHLDDAVELVADRDAAVTRVIPAHLLELPQLRRVLQGPPVCPQIVLRVLPHLST